MRAKTIKTFCFFALEAFFAMSNVFILIVLLLRVKEKMEMGGLLDAAEKRKRQDF